MPGRLTHEGIAPGVTGCPGIMQALFACDGHRMAFNQAFAANGTDRVDSSGDVDRITIRRDDCNASGITA